MPQYKMVILNENLLIGRGANKDLYIHPDFPERCIRINSREKDEHQREMYYRKVRERRHLPESSLLASYYGTVQTNLGEGFVFERISDYDGTTSKTLDDLIRLECKARERKQSENEVPGTETRMPLMADVLSRLRERYFTEKIIVCDMHPANCMVQFDTPTHCRVRIIDGIGITTLIPVVCYIDFLAAGHIKREWDRFMQRIESFYPGFLTEEEIRRLTAT